MCLCNKLITPVKLKFVQPSWFCKCWWRRQCWNYVSRAWGLDILGTVKRFVGKIVLLVIVQNIASVLFWIAQMICSLSCKGMCWKKFEGSWQGSYWNGWIHIRGKTLEGQGGNGCPSAPVIQHVHHQRSGPVVGFMY